MFNFWYFLRKKWSEYSEARGQKGTLIDDLAIKPTGLVMSDFYNLLVNQRKINNISQWKGVSDSDLDAFGGKFFIPRINGGFAFGIARIWFNSKIDIIITENARFVSTNGLQYVITQPGYISKNSFKISTDRIALFYIDVPITAAAKGVGYNINAGEISQLINIDFEYHSVTNLNPLINGSKYESNQEYFNRLYYSINDRGMMNQKSLNVFLPQFFPNIKAMYISGSGDRYMNRDLIAGFDSSEQFNKVDYLGKTNGDNIVKHIAFYGIFPPNAGSVMHDRYWGSHSDISAYEYPLTIDQAVSDFNPSDNNVFKSDPAFLGFPLDQEFTDEMYRGIYFNDYKRFFEHKTGYLFNIDDEEISYDKILPGDNWIYGACGRSNRYVGNLQEGLGAIDVINMSTNIINLCGGSSESLSISKDILKRTGIKLTGLFTFPEPDEDDVLNSNLQIMVGGVNETSIVDGYTGIGFGIRMIDAYQPDDINALNAVIYFAHSEKYGTTQIYATDDDINDHISISNMGALAEKQFKIQPGVEYSFEFIIYDDLHLTLLINKTSQLVGLDPDEHENILHFELPKKILNIFSDSSKGGILSTDSTRYGTMMKITLDTKSLLASKMWSVIGLKAFDINPERAMALFAINVLNIESPITIYTRAYGNSAVGNSQSDGYRALIWDKESQTVTSINSELNRGGWIEANGISDVSSSKKTLTGLLSHTINNIDRYVVENRFGKNIFLLFITSGTSKPTIRYNGDLRDNIQSLLRVDYVKIESENLSMYHANNKADIYVATLSNLEEYKSVITTLRKNSSDTYFEMNSENCSMPILEIISVTTGETFDLNNIISESEYTIVDADLNFMGSSLEVKRISLNESNSNTITVEYKSYPEIENIQNYFDDSIYKKIYGNILVKHKYPCDLNISLFFTGIGTEDNIISEVKSYVDNNIDGIFIIKNLISNLYNKGLVNNIKEPITILYSKFDDELNIKTGSFTDQLEIRSIDFFRIINISAQRL